MAITFPVALSVFASTLRVLESQFWREDFIETSGTARGDILTSEIAAPKWRARVALSGMTYEDAAAAQAMIELIGPHQQFYLYNPMKPYPRHDPTGSIVAAATVTIYAVGSDNRSIRLQGLPAGYVISAGDMFSYSFGSNPVRRCLCRAVETVTASGIGLTPAFAVSGTLRTGTVSGLVVNLRKPFAKMMFAPGTFTAGSGTLSRVTTGMSFEAIEAY
jgi:hypothetical protein